MLLGLAALAASLAGTGPIRRWALARGFVDRPGHRKIHAQPVALGGGIVIFWITLGPMTLAGALALYFNRHAVPDWLPDNLAQHIPGLAGRAKMLVTIVMTTALLHIMGLLDDKRALGPKIKLAVQLAAALVVTTAGGLRFSFFIPNPALTTALSVLWIIIITNAFNFLDNMDGLSAGVAVICGGIILTAALASGQVFVSAMLFLLVGSLLGFLRYNFAPAKIFMGDSGSLVVGYLLALATMQTTYYHQDGSGHWYNTFMPLLALSVPLYDFISVTLIRLLQGKSPFVGDKQHFSHRLVRRGMTHRQAVLTIYLATACTGLGAAFLHQVSRTGAIMIMVQTVMVLLIINILERPEKKDESPLS